MRCGNAAVAGGGEELGVQVALLEPEVGQVQHLRAFTLHQAQRIKLGDQVTAIRPDLDQARDRRLLGAVGGLRVAARCGGGDRRLLGPRGNARDDRTVRPLGGGAGSQAIEVTSPLRRNRGRVTQVLLVKAFEKIGVAAVEGCGFKHSGGCSVRAGAAVTIRRQTDAGARTRWGAPVSLLVVAVPRRGRLLFTPDPGWIRQAAKNKFNVTRRRYETRHVRNFSVGSIKLAWARAR